MVPTELLPPLTPSTLQVTAVLEMPCTVAVNCCVPAGGSAALSGETLKVNTLICTLALCEVPEDAAAMA